MTILPEPWETHFLTFFFVYVRVSAALWNTPVISNDTVPSPIRAGLAFWVSVIILGPIWGLHSAPPDHVIPIVTNDYDGIVSFSLAVAAEVLIGWLLGFIAEMLVQTISLSGEIIGQQAGFSAASVFDPITGQDIFLVAQIKTLFGTMIFFAIGGPETVLQVLGDSFRLLHPGEFINLADFANAGYHTLILNESRQQALTLILYRVGIQIAAPIMTTMFLVSLAEAFIAKVSPQLNILAVGFAIRIFISLVVLASAMPTTMLAYKHHLQRYTTYAYAALSWLTP
ncbi:MAG: hypothetical protein GC154_14040 [bacterium]|nr:hypothetical protein [bacterium]